METSVPVKQVDANLEVLARIVKAASKKYDCTMQIDFKDGRRVAKFVGDDVSKAFIAEEVQEIFTH